MVPACSPRVKRYIYISAFYHKNGLTQIAQPPYGGGESGKYPDDPEYPGGGYDDGKVPTGYGGGNYPDAGYGANKYPDNGGYGGGKYPSKGYDKAGFQTKNFNLMV